MTSLATPTSEESGSRLDKEFGHVMSVQLSSDHLFTAATEDGNEEKNRNPNSLPCMLHATCMSHACHMHVMYIICHMQWTTIV